LSGSRLLLVAIPVAMYLPPPNETRPGPILHLGDLNNRKSVKL
jgi:hypothetical protein